MSIENTNAPITLGATYKDKVTGFQGIAIGHVYYLTGCNQTLIVPRVKEDGSGREGVWYDDQRLEIVGIAVVVLDNGNTPGCADAAPTKF